MRVLVVLAVGVAAYVFAQSLQGTQVSVADWQADIRVLQAEVIKRHPNPFQRVSRSEFERAFSALQQLAELRWRTNAILIGEPSRAKPNHPSEGREINLPRTGIRAWVSTQIVRRDPALGDVRQFPVDVVVPLRFMDYSRGRDAALEHALAYARNGRN